MKTIYSVTTTCLNGTVTMCSNVDLFATKELAEKSIIAIREENEKLSKESLFPFNVFSEIKEVTLFESEEEIPVLNKKD